MPTFGQRSLDNLKACHPLLQKVFNEAIKDFDFAIIQATRGKADQEEAFRKGNSKAHFGQSAHNFTPSVAADCTPTPLDWNDSKAFKSMAQHMFAAAKRVDVPIRWGGNWSTNAEDKSTSSLVDMPHFELHPWRSYAK